MKLYRKIMVLAIIGLFIGAGVVPSVNSEIYNLSIGNTLYVGGSGPSNYSSIQDAIDDANSGDTIFVYNGTYHEKIIVDKSIDIIGEDKNNTIIDYENLGSMWYYPVLIIADSVNICEFTITSHGQMPGIKLENVEKCQIFNNYFEYCSHGIALSTSSYNNINNNTVTSCGTGISLRDLSDGNRIENNILQFNNFGISLYELYYSEGSSNNIICNNIINFNNIVGIKLRNDSNGNLIFHNDFKNNQNAYDECSNSWDNGYPSGGNYWYDYDGVDIDGDGMGDTPYPIDGGNNQDKYPLMNPFNLENQPPELPEINGPIKGRVRQKQTYTVETTDPDEDDINFIVDWGDNQEEEYGPNPSGETLTVSHTWYIEGTYVVKVKAKDVFDAESDWATLEISMPKNKPINTPFIRFLENHPYLFPLLRQLFEI